MDPRRRCTVAIGSSTGTVGCGILLSKSLVLTCAHVVNSALGIKDPYGAKLPRDPVLVGLAGVKDPFAARVGEVGHWLPLLKDNRGALSDCAILTLEKEAPEGFTAATFRESSTLFREVFDAVGYPQSWSGQSQSGLIGKEVDDGYELLPGVDARLFVRPGFSGGAVFRESRRTGAVSVVGMVVAARQIEADKTAYMRSTESLKKFLQPTLSTILFKNLVVDDFPHIATTQRTLSKFRKSTGSSTSFDVRMQPVESTQNISDLFRQELTDTYDDQSTLTPERVFDAYNALLIQSPGGAGKSYFLAKMVEVAVDRGYVPFVLDARNAKVEPKETDSLAEVISTLAVAGGADAAKLCEEPSGQARLVVFLDRLNEKPDFASRLLKTIANLARRHAAVKFFVADRVKERTDISSLERGTILPLPRSIISDHLKTIPPGIDMRLLAMPFFLDMQLSIDKRPAAGEPILTRCEMFEKFFRTHVFGDYDPTKLESTFEALAKAAFEGYRHFKSTVMTTDAWKDFVDLSSDTRATIVNELMIKSPGDKVEFRHQLFHDFLAGTHLARKGSGFWRPEHFDTATLDGQSFDAIEFAAEQIGSERASDFLEQVYDWSWPAVMETVRNFAAGRHGGLTPIPDEFSHALFYVNAVRLFDMFENTRVRSRSIFAVSAIARNLGSDSFATFEDLRNRVRDNYRPTTPEFQKWKSVFLLPENELLREEDLKLLWATPFLAWTAANIYRRLRNFDAGLERTLRTVYAALLMTDRESARGIGVRWRILHVLGAARDQASFDFLWSVTCDSGEDRWVRSGAVRSYLEAAYRTDSDASRKMLGTIVEWLRTSDKVPHPVALQIRQSWRLATSPPRDDWYLDWQKIMRAGVESATRAGEKQQVDTWQRKERELRDFLVLESSGFTASISAVNPP